MLSLVIGNVTRNQYVIALSENYCVKAISSIQSYPFNSELALARTCENSNSVTCTLTTTIKRRSLPMSCRQKYN